MASATSDIASVTTYTGNKQQRRSGKGPSEKGFYQTQTTTLVGGGVKRETYRVDAKGQNSVKISESEVDADGNVTKQKTLSTATAAEKRALSDPDSRLSKSVKKQVKDSEKKLEDANVSNLDKAAGGSGNTATDNGEGQSQPAGGEELKPPANANQGIKGGTYPVDIDSTKQDIIKFDMLEYRPSKFKDRPGVDNIDASKIIASVILPVPGGIQDQSNATWTPETMNPLQKAAAGFADGAIGGDVAGSIDKAMGQIKTQSDEIRSAIRGYFTGQASGIGQQALQRGAGVVLNPNMELLFGGPSLRQFAFNFLLAPRSKSEEDEVVNIIRFFKQGMSPIKSEKHLFLKSPNTFRLRYIHRKAGADKENKFLTKFKECALSSTGVNYTPNTNYATFPDGGMVAYQLSLTFQELEPVFNNDYADLEGIGY